MLIRTPFVGTAPTDQDTLVFKLDVECKAKEGAPKDSRNLDDLYENHLVTAGMLLWDPQGEQESMPQLIVRPTCFRLRLVY